MPIEHLESAILKILYKILERYSQCWNTLHHLIFFFSSSEFHPAEDWLNPSIILEAFEARAARMSVACAKNLSKFANPEEGNLHLVLRKNIVFFVFPPQQSPRTGMSYFSFVRNLVYVILQQIPLVHKLECSISTLAT